MLDALRLLASNALTRQQRNQAAAELDGALDAELAGLLGTLRRSLDNDAIEDIRQHLLLKASTGDARFRGVTEAEALAWCRHVARNKARDFLRGQKRSTLFDALSPEAQEAMLPAVDPDEIRLTLRPLDDVLVALEGALTGKYAEDKRKAMRCFLEYIGGASIEEQVGAWGFGGARPDDPSALELRKARDRVYKYRERGQAYVGEALEALRAGGAHDPDALGWLQSLLSR
jgi:DNA-directed RNA polymerase specialized sigma24 family protein